MRRLGSPYTNDTIHIYVFIPHCSSIDNERNRRSSDAPAPAAVSGKRSQRVAKRTVSYIDQLQGIAGPSDIHAASDIHAKAVLIVDLVREGSPKMVSKIFLEKSLVGTNGMASYEFEAALDHAVTSRKIVKERRSYRLSTSKVGTFMIFLFIFLV